jgi:hypothetical protein
MQAAHFQDLDAECLEPGKKPVQRRLISQRPVHHGLHRLHRGGKALEVQQGLGREDSRDADLVVGRCHPGPQPIGNGQCQLPQCYGRVRRAPLLAGDFLTLVRLWQGIDGSPEFARDIS